MIASDAERSLGREDRALVAKLRALPPEGDEPDWQKLEAAIRAEVGDEAPRPWWRNWRWLVPLGRSPTTAALAFVVIGRRTVDETVEHARTVRRCARRVAPPAPQRGAPTTRPPRCGSTAKPSTSTTSLDASARRARRRGARAHVRRRRRPTSPAASCRSSNLRLDRRARRHAIRDRVEQWLERKKS